MRLSVLAVWAVLAITCVYGANPDIILSPRDTTVRYLAYGDTQDFTFFAYNVPETNRTAEYAVTTFVIIPEGFNIPNYTPYAAITGTSNGTLATYNMAFPNNTIIFPSVVLDDPINTYIDYDFTVGLVNAGFSSETYDKPFGYIVYITPVEEIFDGTTSDSVIKAETIVSGERRAYRVSRPAYGEQPDLISFSQCKSQNLENSTDTTPIRAAILWNRYSDYNGNSSKNFASDIVCGGSDDATLKLADPEGADSYSAMCPTYVDSTSDPSLSHSSVYIFVDVMHFWLTDLNATVSYTLTAYPNQTYILPPLEPDTSKNAGPTSYIAPLTLKKSGDDLKISWTVSAVSPGSDIAYYAVYSDYLLDSNTRLALAANHSFANPCFLQSLIPVIPMADVNGDKASAVITNFYKDAVEYNNAPWTVNVLVSNKESAAAYQPSTTKPDTGLSGGAIAGIVIGSIIGAIILIVIIGVVGLYVFRRVAKKDYQNI